MSLNDGRPTLRRIAFRALGQPEPAGPGHILAVAEHLLGLCEDLLLEFGDRERAAERSTLLKDEGRSASDDWGCHRSPAHGLKEEISRRSSLGRACGVSWYG